MSIRPTARCHDRQLYAVSSKQRPSSAGTSLCRHQLFIFYRVYSLPRSSSVVECLWTEHDVTNITTIINKGNMLLARLPQTTKPRATCRQHYYYYYYYMIQAAGDKLFNIYTYNTILLRRRVDILPLRQHPMTGGIIGHSILRHCKTWARIYYELFRRFTRICIYPCVFLVSVSSICRISWCPPDDVKTSRLNVPIASSSRRDTMETIRFYYQTIENLYAPVRTLNH